MAAEEPSSGFGCVAEDEIELSSRWDRLEGLVISGGKALLFARTLEESIAYYGLVPPVPVSRSHTRCRVINSETAVS
jgi:hypothetical protein